MQRQVITIYISKKLLEQIDRDAKEKSRSRSNYIEAELKKILKPN